MVIRDDGSRFQKEGTFTRKGRIYSLWIKNHRQSSTYPRTFYSNDSSYIELENISS
jgi:hypothetical protein